MIPAKSVKVWKGTTIQREDSFLRCLGILTAGACGTYLFRCENMGEEKDLTLEYCAGLFDGEGNITIHEAKAKIGRPNQNSKFSLRVTIANQNVEVLIRCQRQFGGYLYPYGSPGVYHWILANIRAADFLKDIHPWLKIKGKESLVGIFFQLSKDRQGHAGSRSRSEVKVREEIFLKQELLRTRQEWKDGQKERWNDYERENC